MKNKTQKIALIFDWMDDAGGMEHVNLAMAETFPEADIFTSVYEPKKFPTLDPTRVRTTFLQYLPKKLRPKHQFLAPLMPLAFRLLNLKKYDLIISSTSSGYAQCITKQKKQTHICYCHCPVRYLYHAKADYEQNYPLPKYLHPFRFLLRFMFGYLRWEDQRGAQTVDHWIANSGFIAERIKKYYLNLSLREPQGTFHGIESKVKVIYPGVKVNRFYCPKNTESLTQSEKNTAQQHKNHRKRDKAAQYFLALGRFIPYKKFDLLVETFAKNRLPLKLAGTGPELEKCKNLAKKLGADNIEFLGFVPDKDLVALYRSARAFLFPAEEDFGLTPVEAMLCGIPVIYFDSGGATESVGKMGAPFQTQTLVALDHAIEYFIHHEDQYEAAKIILHAKKFSEQRFKKALKVFVANI
jgi:glycosyltransferase involved in cell wall biosynthesis